MTDPDRSIVWSLSASLQVDLSKETLSIMNTCSSSYHPRNYEAWKCARQYQASMNSSFDSTSFGKIIEFKKETSTFGPSNDDYP